VKDASITENEIRPVFLSASSIFIYCLIGGWTIWELSKRYGYSDTQGFWMDGLLRELAGRLAPLVQALAIVVPLICVLSSKYKVRLGEEQLVYEVGRSDRTLLFPMIALVVLLSVSVMASPSFLLS
jgi:hypothetical protein